MRDIINNLSWFLIIVSIYAKLLVIKHKVLGFYLWIIADTLWMLYNFYIGANAQAFLMFIYIFFSLYGIYKWRVENE
jgi:hypothetical protein